MSSHTIIRNELMGYVIGTSRRYIVGGEEVRLKYVLSLKDYYRSPACSILADMCDKLIAAGFSEEEANKRLALMSTHLCEG